MTIINAPTCPPGRVVKTCSINSSPLNPLKTKENIEAPIKITKTNELNFTVLKETSFRFLNVSSPLVKAKIAAPAAPTEADSVGVATPNKIEPSTNKIKIKGGRTFFKSFEVYF